MSMIKKAPAVLLALSLFAAGCGNGGGTKASESGTEAGNQASSSAEGKSITMYACEPQHLFPSNTNDNCGSEILSQLFTPLININDELKPVFGADDPDTVAESITSNDDKSVWTIKLKDGWTFHNGEKVDADSYVRAWNYAVNPANAQANVNFFEHIKGFKASNEAADGKEVPLEGLKVVDPLTIEITLDTPFAPFVTMLGYNAFYPLPKAALDDVKAFEEAPIGNGGYKMDGSWQHNEHVKVVAYEDYPGTKPEATMIENRIYADINTAYNDLRAGTLDIVEDLPTEHHASYEADLGERLYTGPSSTFGYLAFPVNEEKFKDPKIRQAMSMAIDREAIIKAVFNDSLTAADDYVSPLVDGYRKGACKACEYKPEEAKKLFDEAGGIDGPIEVWFNSGASQEEWIEAVSNNWKQNLGISEVKFQSLIFADYLNKLDEKKVTGPYRLGWSADYPSMENYLAPLLSTKGATNYGGYSNPKVDELIIEGNKAKTLEESVKKYQEADDLLLEDMPIIPITFGKKYSGTSERVSNYGLSFNANVEVLKLKVSE